MRYWDVLCDRVAEGEECLAGDLCPFSHTREEISYHAAKYKTKLCNDRDCRGQEVCCFAHGEEELRNQALDRYSYWSIFGVAGAPAPNQAGQAMNGGLDLQGGYALGAPRGGGATGALYHPKVYKHRFCASYPNIVGCRRGEACAFAHNREEIRTSLLDEAEEAQRPQALTNDFFMYKFKTLWCPIGVQHDWQTCVYAHNYQDARRHPGIGYGPRPCPYWKRKETTLEYSQRCPLGVRCPFSHGAKEQLYHPSYFKTVTCQDWPNSNCPRGKLCAFWHRRSQQRSRGSDEDFNYKLPIPEACLTDALQADFLSPPFKLLNSLQADISGFPEFATEQGMQGDFDPGMGNMMPMAGGPCEPCQPPNCNWGTSSEMPALCNYGTPATPTTTADSDEAASADSGHSREKVLDLPEADRSNGAAVASQQSPQNMAMHQQMPPLPNAEYPQWQGGYDPQAQLWGPDHGWAPGPHYPSEGCMPPSPHGVAPNGHMGGGSPHMGPGTMPGVGSPHMGPGSMGQGGMSGGMMPPNGFPGPDGFQPCGPMPGFPMQQHNQQQMCFYPQVPPNMQQPMGPASQFRPQESHDPMAPNMVPMGPQMMPQSPHSPQNGGFPSDFEQQVQKQTASYWGQPAPAPFAEGAYWVGGNGAPFDPRMQRPLMTIEEMAPESCQAVQAIQGLPDQGKPAALTNGASATSPLKSVPKSPLLLPMSPSGTPKSRSGGDESPMPTCNGFIHFKDPDTLEEDDTPTGRPRAMSH